ncbi:cell envelope integrity protein TolA [Desulfobacter curvatus]|uniref:cell envelope integrity protein TolA n=1 Tax=Desulfobacter curvatus TaxID=2290 RepID=UPI00036F913F|nr:cell envelope integrity protein TolA [Desulfobacter curvatus]
MNIRSQIQNRQKFISEPQSIAPGGFFGVCLVSLICHVLFFTSLYFLHDFQFSAPKPRVITVDLVTFAPGPASAQTSEKSQLPDESPSDNLDKVNPDAVSQIQSQPAEPREPEIPVIKPEVSLKSKPRNLKELIAAREKEPPQKKPPKENLVEKKKKQEEEAKKKMERNLAKAKKEQAEKREKQRQAQLKSALERMKASVASKENGAQGTNSSGSGAVGATGSGGGGEASPLRLYQMVIKSAIEQNWVFNEAMAGLNQELEVRLFIKILKSGEIRDISFETRSGNHYLDESAKKAVQRANPLPELPKGMFSYDLVLGFSPRGLK